MLGMLAAERGQRNLVFIHLQCSRSHIMNEVSSLEKWELKCFTESAGEAATEVADAGQEVVEAGMGA